MVRSIIIMTTAFLVVLLICSSATCQTITIQTSDPFPHYDSISRNVEFWIKVYTQYETTQGIVHDSRDLSIIYDIIDLEHPDQPGAHKINNKRMKRANDRIVKVLKRLTHNPESEDAECMRVAALFGYKASSAVFRKAALNVRCQAGQKNRFLIGLKRSGAYLEHIRKIFHSHNLPEDLSYLPHVESSFNYDAYSKFGAAGIWQFTRSTGKRFMKIGYVLDERRDPLTASHAAARLLNQNYRILGDWPLAITAYNHGTTGMRKAKSKHSSYEKIIRHYRSRTFKFASRNFYSEFLAARIIAKNPERFFGDITMDNPLRFRTVSLEGYADFNELSTYFGVSASVLKNLNPALRKPVIDGQKYIPKGYSLRLPLREEDESRATLTSINQSLYKSKQKPSRFYTVQRGDTAGKIANIHGVELTDLIEANNLNRRATIYPHQTLRIPLPGETVTQTEVTKARVGMPEEKKPLKVQLTSVIPSEPSFPTGQTSLEEQEPSSAILLPEIPVTVTDTIETTKKETKEINPEIVTADIQIVRTYNQDGLAIGLIQVEVEETLGHYADWLKIPTQELRRLNELSYGSVLHMHQEIKIPLRKVSAEEFEERRYEYYKNLQEDFFAIYRIESLITYRVKSGDSFWTLCRDKFDIPLWLLKRCNPEVDFADLRVHQDLIVPSVVKS